MVRIFDSSVCGRAGRSEVTLSHADHSLAAGQRRNLDGRNGVREYIIPVSPIRSHHSSRRHDFLIIILGIHQEDQAGHGSGLAIGVDGHEGDQAAHGGRGEIGDGNGRLFGIYAASNRNAIAHLAIHTNGLLIAIASHKRRLQPVR